LDPCGDLAASIEHIIAANPPVQASKGSVIRPGVSEELDQLRRIATGGKEYLLQLQQKESEATGILP